MSGWRTVVGVRVAGGQNAPAKPPRITVLTTPADERTDRPAPLRLRVRGTDDDALDEFNFAAEVVEVVRPIEGTAAPARELGSDTLFAGRYRFEEYLGKTGAAERFVAVQEPLVRRVVLTLLDAVNLDKGGREALEGRFLREASVLSRMRHPSLAPVHEAGRTPEGGCFATEELLYGSTLAELVERGSLGPDRIVAIGADIAGALVALHEAGVVHRCLRADHIVIGPRVWRGGAGAEVAQVGRYGLETTAETLADNEDVESALAWPPEVHGGQEPNESADIYAVGAILYRALAGRPPYEGTANEVKLTRLAEEPPALARDGNNGLADRLRDVAERCLQAAPEKRYPSARLLLAELEALALAPPPSIIVPPPALMPPPFVAAPQALPLRGAVIAAFAGALVPTAALVFLILRYPSGWGPTPAVQPPAPAAAAVVAVAPPAAPVAAPVAPPADAAPAGATAEEPVAAPAPAPAPTAAPATPAARAAADARAAARRAATPATSAPIPAPAPVAPAVVEPAVVEPVVVPVAIAPPAPVATAAPVAPAPEPPRAAEAPRAAEVPGAAALSGLWLGKVSGGSFALDLSVSKDGRVSGRARRSDGAKEGMVLGRVSTSDEGLRVELQVSEDDATVTYSGLIVGSELRGRVYAGGKSQGRFTAQR